MFVLTHQHLKYYPEHIAKTNNDITTVFVFIYEKISISHKAFIPSKICTMLIPRKKYL